jgi:hypothetical protein
MSTNEVPWHVLAAQASAAEGGNEHGRERTAVRERARAGANARTSRISERAQ